LKPFLKRRFLIQLLPKSACVQKYTVSMTPYYLTPFMLLSIFSKGKEARYPMVFNACYGTVLYHFIVLQVSLYRVSHCNSSEVRCVTICIDHKTHQASGTANLRGWQWRKTNMRRLYDSGPMAAPKTTVFQGLWHSNL
jgi:hypothetical protein